VNSCSTVPEEDNEIISEATLVPATWYIQLIYFNLAHKRILLCGIIQAVPDFHTQFARPKT
jgi:hypothetical protein